MKSVPATFLRPGPLAVALALAGGLVQAADNKPDPQPADKKAEPKAAAKGTAPAGTNTNAVSLVVVFPKSVFNATLEAGRDPFFPTSKRRLPKPVDPPKPPPVVVPPSATNTTAVPIPSPPAPGTPINPPSVTPPPPDRIGSASLSLRGIVGNKAKKWATIHTGVKSYDFLKGDEMLIRLPNEKTLKVRCVDIRDRSAVFQADGEPHTREIFLREGL